MKTPVLRVENLFLPPSIKECGHWCQRRQMNRIGEFLGWSQSKGGNDLRTKLHQCCICAFMEFTRSPQTYPDWDFWMEMDESNPYDLMKQDIKERTCEICQTRHPEYFNGDAHVLGDLVIEFDEGEGDIRRGEE